MTHIKRFFFLLLAGVCFLSACNLNSDPVEYTYDNVMLVVNQGNYSTGNGTVAYYHETERKIENNVLNYGLGAIIQSVAVASNGNVFVICNNPDKVEVFNAVTKEVIGTELFKNDLSTPRYMAMDDEYLYITNWGPAKDAGGGWMTYPNSYVLRINRYTGEADDEQIPCGSDAEEIISIGNKLYVAAGEGVVVIDKSSKTAVDTIIAPTFAGGAKHFVIDQQERLWASYPNAYPDGGLLKINLSTGEREEIAIPIDWMGQIAINVNAGKIYTYKTTFNENYSAQEAKIHELDIATKEQKVFAEPGTYFYSIGVSPATGNVYTAEVNNFTSNSELLVYDATGKILDRPLTGIGTCDFKFFSIIGTK
jgi:DNA-binding beta-propeller fold protein YncE